MAENAHGPSRGPSATHTSGATRSTRSRASMPDARNINLESAVTTCADAWQNKGIHYRMQPANVACLTAAGVDCAGQQSRPGLGLPRPCRDNCRFAARRNQDDRRRRQCGRCRRARRGRPVRMRQLHIERAGETDVDWLLTIPNREGSVLGRSFAHCSGGRLTLRSCGHEPTRSNATGGCANVDGGSAP